MDEKIKLSIYRIIQEGLSNSSKHADAHLINLKVFHKNSNLEIVISDNGKGMDEEQSQKDNTHYGLAILKDRVNCLNGKIFITTGKKSGTEIKVIIPIEKEY